MEIDILDSLEDLGYSGPLIKKDVLKEALDLGPKSIDFTTLVSWLSKELQVLCDLESCIYAISDPEESGGFLLEVSSYLKELNCPYDVLTQGEINERLSNKKTRIILLDFLCKELQCARILYARKRPKKSLDIELGSSTTADCLTSIGKVLSVDVHGGETAESIIDAITSKVEVLSIRQKLQIPEPILTIELSPAQWAMLEELQRNVHSEYKVRREMLLTRLDVTIQSFKWGENAQGKENEIAKLFIPRRMKLKAEPSVNTSDIIAARKDITVIEKTSSAVLVKNTKSSVNRIVIGAVPNRGGNPKEQRPPVEMPSWQKRSGGPPGRGGGRGGRGRGGKKW